MKPKLPTSLVLPSWSRRRFIQALAAGGVMLSLPPFAKTALARETSEDMSGQVPVLTGT